MNNKRVVAAVTALLLALAANLHGQDVKVGGQIRPRTELRRIGSKGDMITTMRARVDVRASAGPRVQAFVQAQDVRLWGEEASTTSNDAKVDLHQAYIDISSWARAGRQELSYGEERLIGAADWIQQARAFDGLRLRAAGKKGSVDVFALQVADATAAGKTADDRFFGVYATLNTSIGALEPYALRNQNAAVKPTHQNTIGARISGSRGALLYRAEGALQRGRRSGADVNAEMLTAYAGIKHGAWQALLWVDHLSGDSNAADSAVEVFETLFATNHKFYGIADVFTNIPLHTANRGLNDYALKTSYKFSDSVTGNADVHRFNAAASDALTNARFGEELDVFGAYKYSPRLTVSAGAARFIAGPGLKQVLPQSSSQAFSYLMLTAVF